MIKYVSLNVFAMLFLSTFLSGCAVVGAAYDVVTLPIVLVGEAAGGIADAVSGDDDEEKEEKEEKETKEERDNAHESYDNTYNNYDSGYTGTTMNNEYGY